jgi:hypothetical protein
MYERPRGSSLGLYVGRYRRERDVPDRYGQGILTRRPRRHDPGTSPAARHRTPHCLRQLVFWAGRDKRTSSCCSKAGINGARRLVARPLPRSATRSFAIDRWCRGQSLLPRRRRLMRAIGRELTRVRDRICQFAGIIVKLDHLQPDRGIEPEARAKEQLHRLRRVWRRSLVGRAGPRPGNRCAGDRNGQSSRNRNRIRHGGHLQKRNAGLTLPVFLPRKS